MNKLKLILFLRAGVSETRRLVGISIVTNFEPVRWHLLTFLSSPIMFSQGGFIQYTHMTKY